MTGINIHFPILNPNTSDLNLLTPSYRVADCMERQDPQVCCPQEVRLAIRDRHNCVWKGVRKQADVAVPIAFKTDFKPKLEVKKATSY